MKDRQGENVGGTRKEKAHSKSVRCEMEEMEEESKTNKRVEG